MVVVTSASSSLQFFPAKRSSHFDDVLCKPISPTSLLFFHQIYGDLTRPGSFRPPNSNRVLSVRAYIENPNSISNFARKVVGALPVIGLVARVLNDEGGIGGDIIDFAEFRRRVGKKCSVNDSRAFYEFQERRGRVMNFSFRKCVTLRVCSFIFCSPFELVLLV